MAFDVQIVIDCPAPHALADWWAEALGWQVEPQDEALIRRMVETGAASEADTTTHRGALENDGFRRAFLREVARLTGRRFVPAPDTDFAAVREARLDRLGDLIVEHADTDALWRLIENGPPVDLPLLPPGAGR